MAVGLFAAADSGVELIGAAIGARPDEGCVAAAVHDGKAAGSRSASAMALGALPRRPSWAQKRRQ